METVLWLIAHPSIEGLVPLAIPASNGPQLSSPNLTARRVGRYPDMETALAHERALMGAPGRRAFLAAYRRARKASLPT